MSHTLRLQLGVYGSVIVERNTQQEVKVLFLKHESRAGNTVEYDQPRLNLLAYEYTMYNTY